MFSYLSPEQRVRADHPLRAIRAMTDRVFGELSPRFTKTYSDIGRPSIPPEQLLRARLLQSLYYTVRRERLLMEEIDYSVLYRWFVGLSMDDPIWPCLQDGTRCTLASVACCRNDPLDRIQYRSARGSPQNSPSFRGMEFLRIIEVRACRLARSPEIVEV